MISLRRTLGAAALLAVVTTLATGCGGREGPGNNDAGDQPGCTGVCSEDGGSDAGTQPDAGQTAPTVMTVAEARKARYETWVTLENVIVTAVDDVNAYSRDPNQIFAQFWVADDSSPSRGIFVKKFRTDTPTHFVPKVGQRLNLTGWLQSASKFDQFIAYRTQLANQFAFRKQSGPLQITLLSENNTLPADNTAPAGFGNADGGFGRPNPELAGSRVHIPGPLVLTNPTPEAMHRVVTARPDDPTYFGFEVSGGILVNNRKTYGESPTDGGPARCDWQALVRNDGGTVVFPNGIRGVWDTYSFAPCTDGGVLADGGVDNVVSCFNNGGRVPGAELSDGGFNNYTHVLYPQNCTTDLVGEWDAGTPEE